MNALVIDAEAALALVADGPGRAKVRTAIRDRIVRGDRILVPAVFWPQLIDGLVRRHVSRPDALVEAVYELEQLGIETAEVGRPGILALVDAVGRGVAAADAAYLVLAEAAAADLVTGSPELAAIAGSRSTLVRGRRAGAPRPNRSWARWKGAAAYLRELRASL